MSPRPSTRARARRRGLAAVGVLGASLVAVPAALANPVSLQLNYTCNFPLLKPQPLALLITSDIPATIPTNTGTGAFTINAKATVVAGAASALRSVEAASIEGTAVATSTITLPAGNTLNLAIGTVIAPTQLPSSGGFDTSATGKTPSLSFTSAGNAVIRVNGVVLTLTPKLADGTLSGLDT